MRMIELLYMKKKGPYFLRSDGKSEFKSGIRRDNVPLLQIMRVDVVSVQPTSPVSTCVNLMAKNGIKCLPVILASKKPVGIISALDIVNFFGGGKYFKIMERLGHNFYKAMEQPIELIMSKDVVSVRYDAKIEETVKLMIKHDLSLLLVKDERGVLVGVVSVRDFLEKAKYSLPDVAVREVMKRDVVSISLNDSVREACVKAVTYKRHRLPVTFNNKVMGIFSTIDFIRYLASSEPYKRLITGTVEEALNIRVADIATPKVIYVSPTDRLSEAYRVMHERKLGYLPVIENGKLVGYISEKELLRFVVENS